MQVAAAPAPANTRDEAYSDYDEIDDEFGRSFGSEELDGTVLQTVRLLDHYYKTLALLGVTHSDVMDDRMSVPCHLFQLFMWGLLMILLLPLVIPGYMLLLPIILISNCIADKVSRTMAATEVEQGRQPEGYTGEDTVTTLRIMGGMGWGVVSLSAYATTGAILLDGEEDISAGGWFFITMGLAFFLIVIAVLFMDQERAVFNVWTHTWKVGFRCGTNRFAELKHLQAKLKIALSQHMHVSESHLMSVDEEAQEANQFHAHDELLNSDSRPYNPPPTSPMRGRPEASEDATDFDFKSSTDNRSLDDQVLDVENQKPDDQVGMQSDPTE